MFYAKKRASFPHMASMIALCLSFATVIVITCGFVR